MGKGRTQHNEEQARLERVSYGWPETIDHPLHRKHPLLKALRPDYTCDGCKLYKSDEQWSYHCAICDFDIHPECILLIPTTTTIPEPETIQHKLHKAHPLVKTPRDAFWCDACAEKGQTCSFSCELCDFHLHPDCAEDTEADPPERLVHEMAKTRRGSYRCSACKKEGKGWSYYCGHCNLDLHPKCGMKMQESGQNGQLISTVEYDVHPKHDVTSGAPDASGSGERTAEMTSAEQQIKMMNNLDAEQAQLIAAMTQFQAMKMQTDALNSITAGAMDSAARVQNIGSIAAQKVGNSPYYWRYTNDTNNNFFTPTNFFRPF